MNWPSMKASQCGPTRRDLLKLALLGAPMLLARCQETPLTVPAEILDGRLHTRIDADSSTTAVRATTKSPEPLGLSRGRDGFYYVPARSKGSARVPLVLYMHGATGTGARGIQRLLPHADATGSIIVAPDSREQTWGIVLGDEGPDMAFIDAALEKVFAAYPIDKARIGVAGFSDGASAALSLGLVNGDLFTGIAAFSAGFSASPHRPTAARGFSSPTARMIRSSPSPAAAGESRENCAPPATRSITANSTETTRFPTTFATPVSSRCSRDQRNRPHAISAIAAARRISAHSDKVGASNGLNVAGAPPKNCPRISPCGKSAEWTFT